MNNDQDFHDSEMLESPLSAAIEATLAEPIPEDAIERVKARAKQLAQPTKTTFAPTIPADSPAWRVSRRVRWGVSVAVAMMLLIAGTTLLIDRSANKAFAQVVEKLKSVNSVRLKMFTRFGKQPEVEGQVLFDGNHMRVEQFQGLLIQVADFDQKKLLVLDTKRKLAQSLELDANVAKELINNPIDQLRRAKSDDAVPLGEELLNGRRTQLYRLPKVDLLGIRGSVEALVWVDRESNLPAKILIRDTDPKAATEIRFEGFVWNEPQDAKLFSMNVPNGYQSGEIILPRSTNPPTPTNGSENSVPVIADGVIHDRVPGHIVWNHTGTAISVLIRDPESVQPQNQKSNELRQWDVTTGKLLWSENVAGAGVVAGSADGKTLATVIGYEVQLRDSSSGKVTRKWTTEVSLSPLAFSPDGKTLAAGITEWGKFGGRGGKPSGGIQIWDIERSALVRTIEDDKPVTFVKYSVDGQSLATSSNEGPIKLWNVSKGELTRQFLWRAGADFSPDGELIACVSATPTSDKTVGRIDVYHLNDGSVAKSFTTNKGAAESYLLSVAFSPDGRSLAATDWNGTVTVWNAHTGKQTESISNNTAGAHVGVFAPDNTTLAIGREDKTLHLWKLSAE